MTRATKPVTRETAAAYRGRPLIVTLHARHLEIREKGRRYSFVLDYEGLYQRAQKQAAERARAERAAARKGRRR